MTFLNTPRFPTGISYGSAGGPVFDTTIVPLRSGRQIKNRNWPYPLHTYNIIPGIKTATALEDVREYFYAMAGRDGVFRYKDFSDFQSGVLGAAPASDDQTLGTGDGSNRDFELKKTYTKGALSMVRPIDGARATSLIVEVGGVTATASDYVFSTGTRDLAFATGAVPATGDLVKAGFHFDVLVSFESDSFNAVIESCDSTTGDLIFNIDALYVREDRPA